MLGFLTPSERDQFGDMIAAFMGEDDVVIVVKEVLDSYLLRPVPVWTVRGRVGYMKKQGATDEMIVAAAVIAVGSCVDRPLQYMYSSNGKGLLPRWIKRAQSSGGGGRKATYAPGRKTHLRRVAGGNR